MLSSTLLQYLLRNHIRRHTYEKNPPKPSTDYDLCTEIMKSEKQIAFVYITLLYLPPSNDPFIPAVTGIFPTIPSSPLPTPTLLTRSASARLPNLGQNPNNEQSGPDHNGGKRWEMHLKCPIRVDDCVVQGVFLKKVEGLCLCKCVFVCVRIYCVYVYQSERKRILCGFLPNSRLIYSLSRMGFQASMVLSWDKCAT